MAESSSDKETNGHHYSGGPKTEVPHHMGKKATGGSTAKAESDGGHHYGGVPKTEPHHIGAKE